MKFGSAGIAVSSGPRSGLNPFQVRTRYCCGSPHARLIKSWSDCAAGAGALIMSATTSAKDTTKGARTRRMRRGMDQKVTRPATVELPAGGYRYELDQSWPQVRH